jgi:hypothetical protein
MVCLERAGALERGKASGHPKQRNSFAPQYLQLIAPLAIVRVRARRVSFDSFGIRSRRAP